MNRTLGQGHIIAKGKETENNQRLERVNNYTSDPFQAPVVTIDIVTIVAELDHLDLLLTLQSTVK